MFRLPSIKLLLLLSASYGIVFLHRQIITPFIPDITARFDITYASAGGLMSALYTAYAATLIPAGWLADRWSNKSLIIVGLAGTICGTMIMALAPSYAYALIGRILTGTAVAIVHCPTVRQISALTPAESRGKAMAMREVAIAFGIVGSLSVIPYVTRWMAVETAFVVACLPLIAAAVCVGLIPRARFYGHSPADAPAMWWNPALTLLVPIAFCTFTAINGLIGWLPTLLQLHHGFDASAAGLLLSVMIVAMIPSSLIAGSLSDRTGLRSPVAAAFTLLLIAGLPGWLGETSMPVLILSAVAAGAGWGGTASIVIVMGAEAGGVRAGWSIGIVTTVAQAASAIASYVLGLLLDLTGSFVTQIIYLGAAAVVSLVLCLIGIPIIGRIARQ